MIVFELPWPPTTNHLYATFNGRRVLSKDGRRYHKAVADALLVAQLDSKLVNAITGEPGFTVRLTFHGKMHDKNGRRMGLRYYDIANCEKAPMDGMTKAKLWSDDSDIDALALVRGAPALIPFVEVCIWRD